MTDIKRFYFFIVTCCVVMVLYGSIAFAQTDVLIDTDKDVSNVSKILSYIVDIAISVISLLVVFLVHSLIKYFSNKTKFDLSTVQDKLLDTLVADAINYAEEKAHSFVKINSKKLPSNEKLEHALEYIWTFAEEHKLPEMTESFLINKIEAKLGINRK